MSFFEHDDSHCLLFLGAAMRRQETQLLTSPGQDPDAEWRPGVIELLDHLAKELALEYVRLMEQAAQDGPSNPPAPLKEED